MNATLAFSFDDPVPPTRVDRLLEDLRARGVPTTPLNIIAFATDAGFSSEAAELLAAAVRARLDQIEAEPTP
jgi:hypothetical protein